LRHAARPVENRVCAGGTEKQVTALQKENDALKLDRAILKKAAAFFAKESE
jgi:transposase-like protein